MGKRWPWLRRVLGFAFLALVGGLLVKYAVGVDWDEVRDSVAQLPRSVLVQAALLCALSHAVYSCLDLFGRSYTRHRLPLPQVLQVNFISYAFNLNMGTLVGGVAFRYRLYSRLGLSYAVITRVLTLSMLTNWLGYLLLAGVLFSVMPLELPPSWKIGSTGLHVLGAACLATAFAYLGLCTFSKQRRWEVRGHELFVPPTRMALLQLAVSACHWMAMGGAIYVLLQGQVSYSTALSVLLVGAIAGVITHVPAGLGVLEAVFIALLSHRVPEHQLLGALLAYRALFYIAPLIAAALLYTSFELRFRRHPKRAEAIAYLGPTKAPSVRTMQ